MQIFKTSKERENILRKIRASLGKEALQMPFPEAEKEMAGLYVSSDTDMEETFAEAFIKIGGKFIFCENEQDFLDNITVLYENRSWEQLLCSDPRMLKLFQNNKISIVEEVNQYATGADACITGCEVLVARTGSILFSSHQHMGRISPVFFPVHIVFAYVNQVVPDLQDAFAYMKKKYAGNLPSMISINSGPSRTADIEKTLVTGVHGPGEVFCFYINAEI